MAEWHVTPDYIVENWTDELFSLMCEKLADRKKRELDAIKGGGYSRGMVSDEELFGRASNLIRVVNN